MASERNGLPRPPRVVFRFIPAASPWPNPVGGLFAPLPRQPFARGVFRSIVPEAALNRFLERASRAPSPAHGPPLYPRSSPREAGTKWRKGPDSIP